MDSLTLHTSSIYTVEGRYNNVHTVLFSYLQRKASSISATERSHRFAEVCDAFDMVGFEVSYQSDVFACLSALLHLGNVEFFQDTNEYSHILDPHSGPIQKTSVRQHFEFFFFTLIRVSFLKNFFVLVFEGAVECRLAASGERSHCQLQLRPWGSHTKASQQARVDRSD